MMMRRSRARAVWLVLTLAVATTCDALGLPPRSSCTAGDVIAALGPVSKQLDPSGAVDWAGVAAGPRARCDDAGTLLELDLSRLGLNGSLPDSWGNASAALRSLDLSFNNLAGTLPGAWGSALGLESLNLKANPRVAGTLPAQWSSMSSLRILHMNDTACEGTLPASWAFGLLALEVLDLSNNRLQGTLPPVPFKGMRNFALKNNSLEGELPVAWSQMKDLYSLDLGWALVPWLPAPAPCGSRQALAAPLGCGPAPRPHQARCCRTHTFPAWLRAAGTTSLQAPCPKSTRPSTTPWRYGSTTTSWWGPAHDRPRAGLVPPALHVRGCMHAAQRSVRAALQLCSPGGWLAPQVCPCPPCHLSQQAAAPPRWAPCPRPTPPGQASSPLGCASTS